MPKKRKIIRFEKKGKKLYLLFYGIEFSIITLIIVGTGFITMGIAWATYIESKNPQEFQIQTIIEEPPMVIDRTSFDLWNLSDQNINDLIYNDGQIRLSDDGYSRQLNDYYSGRPIRDPQGYMQSPKAISENVFICTKVLSLSEEIDYSLRLNKKFQIIHGDGDDRSIALKRISNTSPYIRPNTYEGDPHIDKNDRFRLDTPLPIGREFTSCITIYAPPGKMSKTINIELYILDDKGKVMDLGPMPKWQLTDDSQQNSTSNNFAVGLIDSRDSHPILELRGYCAVEMNDLGDRPSDREREECENP